MYTVIVMSTSANLIDVVNSHLKDGWELVGGVSITGHQASQAMYKPPTKKVTK